MFIDAAIVVFILMELANVVVLYFQPGFRYANGMAAFKPWAAAAADQRLGPFHSYLIRWVANCKAIFILLLALILVLGGPALKLYAAGAMVASIGLYFVTLHPLIARLDRMGQIRPRGYSATLAWMIGGFMALFALALAAQLLWG